MTTIEVPADQLYALAATLAGPRRARRSQTGTTSPARPGSARDLQATVEGFLGDHRTAAQALAGELHWLGTRSAPSRAPGCSWTATCWRRSPGGRPDDGHPARPGPAGHAPGGRRGPRRAHRGGHGRAAPGRACSPIDLSGPAASAPGWLGADAVAAGAQVARRAWTWRGPARTRSSPRRTRLRAHAELLGETRAGDRPPAVRAAERLRRGLAAAREGGGLPAGGARQQPGGPGHRRARCGRPTVARRNRHAALLEELARDAAATGRVLTESSAVVGGRARPGDTNEVIATLAARLPGWGDGELAALGTRPRRPALRRVPGRRRTGLRRCRDGVVRGQAGFRGGVPARPGTGEDARAPAALGDDLLGAGQRAVPAARDGHGGGRSRWSRRRRSCTPATSCPSAGDDDAVASGMARRARGGRGPPDVPTATVADWTRQLVLLSTARTPPTASARRSGAIR